MEPHQPPVKILRPRCSDPGFRKRSGANRTSNDWPLPSHRKWGGGGLNWAPVGILGILERVTAGLLLVREGQSRDSTGLLLVLRGYERRVRQGLLEGIFKVLQALSVGVSYRDLTFLLVGAELWG